MKTSHRFRSIFTCFTPLSFKSLLFVSLLFFLSLDSRAQCDMTAGPDKIIQYSDHTRLNALPQLKSTWKELPKATTNLYLDACYVTDTSMIVVGNQGTILKYNRENWQQIPTGITFPINAVDFYDDMNGIAVGMNDVILKTTDGGNTWNQIASETGFSFVTVQCISAQSIIAGGYRLVAGKPVQNGILKSTDGGNHWELIGEIPGGRISSIDFVNTALGFACTYSNGVFKTIDGGNNWQKLSTELINLSPNYHAIKAVSAQVIFAVGNQGAVLKSDDSGENWMQINPFYVELNTFNNKKLIDTQMASFESILCNSAEDVMISGYLGSERIGFILKWNPEGEYWVEEKVIAGVKPRLTGMIQNASGEITVVGDEGVILAKSTNDKFEWLPSIGLSDPHIPNPLASPELTTTYTVTRTTSTCSATDEVTVYVAKYNDNVKTIQCGQSIQLDSVPYSGNFSGTVKYKWTPARGLDSDTVARPVCTVGEDTKYTGMVILNDGNLFRDSVLSSTTYVKVSTFSANAGEDVIAAPGSQVQLNVTHNYTGSDQLSYKWYPAEGLDDDAKQNPMATVSESITYTVVVTTDSGCVAADEVHITGRVFQPLVFQQEIQLSCGSTIQLDSVKTNYAGQGQLSYLWSPATGLSSDTVPNPVCSVSSNTTYKVNIITPEGNSTSCNVVVRVTAIKINPLSDKKFYCGQQVQLDSVTTNYTGNEKLSYKWTPSTGLSNDTIPNPVVTTNVDYGYTITVTTPGGCTASAAVKVTKQSVPTPSIVGVSVDSQDNNQISWVLPDYEYDSIFIYKETNQQNQYRKIGSVGKNISIFSDTLSQPKVMSNAYKISLLDRCGTETSQSSRHKTMHLAINKGVSNSWNLIWEPYIGFEVATYYIYRGTNENQLSLISSLSGANTQFSDFTAPTGDIYYQIEAVKSGSSGVKGGNVKVKNQAFVSRSNIASYKDNVGVQQPYDISDDILLSPNPVMDYVQVSSKAFNGKRLTLTVCNLQGMVLMRTEMTGTTQNINLSQLSPGMYLVVVDNERVKGCKKLVKK